MEPLRSDPGEWEPEISLAGEIDYFSTAAAGMQRQKP